MMARRPVSGRDGIKVIVSTASWGEVPWTRIPAILGKQGQPRQRLSLLLPLPPPTLSTLVGVLSKAELGGKLLGRGRPLVLFKINSEQPGSWVGVGAGETRGQRPHGRSGEIQL